MNFEPPAEGVGEVAKMVAPAPLPTTFNFAFTAARTQSGTQQILRCDISTPAGTTTVFLDRRGAEGLTHLFAQHLDAWPTTIVVPQLDEAQLASLMQQLPSGPGNGKVR